MPIIESDVWESNASVSPSGSPCEIWVPLNLHMVQQTLGVPKFLNQPVSLNDGQQTLFDEFQWRLSRRRLMLVLSHFNLLGSENDLGSLSKLNAISRLVLAIYDGPMTCRSTDVVL